MTQGFSPISPARQAAYDVLESVRASGYASDALRARTMGFSARDAGLAGQIVFGSLRFEAQLNHLVFFYSGRHVESLDPEVACILRMALFQLRYLERIPAHAAVHESVELVKRVKRSAGGLVNAVLRKVRRDSIPWPDRTVELSCPSSLLARWSEHFGVIAADAIARAALREPLPYIRVPPGQPPPPGLELKATSVAGCFRVLPSTTDFPSSDPTRNLRLHDIGSQAVLPALQLQPGQAYLDLCAAPGNKTRQALETPLGFAVACDISLRRLADVPPLCPRVVLDGEAPLPFHRSFDRIFIDAPCSGTGTIGRNPEIKWRVQEPDFLRFGELQARLVNNALKLLAPAGRLLYATCSLEPEENEEVVRHVLAAHRGVRLESESWRLPGSEQEKDEAGDGFYSAVLVNA